MKVKLVDLADEVFAAVLSGVAMALEGVVVLHIVSRLLHFLGVEGLSHIELTNGDSSFSACDAEQGVVVAESNLFYFVKKRTLKGSVLLPSRFKQQVQIENNDLVGISGEDKSILLEITGHRNATV